MTLAREQAWGYATATPFPHLVLDDFLPPSRARLLSDEFPADPRHDFRWRAGHHRHSQKWTCNEPWVRKWVEEMDLASDGWLTTLEEITGIAPLYADPGLKGGGFHLSLPGSFLHCHADFTVHEDLGMRRALNLLVYLTPDYDPTWGGHLELWDRRMRRCVQRIAPLWNRAVLFSTDATSWHGHPDPMRGPAHAQRRSLALYYYTPWTDGAPWLRTTRYRARPWEYRERLRLQMGRLKRWLA